MSRISARARSGFEQIFESALLRNIGMQPSDEVAVARVATCTAGGRKDRTTVLLTTASLRFKTVSVFRVVDDAASDLCFGHAAQAASATEALAERCNLVCGAFNRGLLAHFEHVALSTPSLLCSTVEKILAELGAEHGVRYEVRINGRHVVDAALSVTGQAPVDFLHAVLREEVDSGELELL